MTFCSLILRILYILKNFFVKNRDVWIVIMVLTKGIICQNMSVIVYIKAMDKLMSRLCKNENNSSISIQPIITKIILKYLKILSTKFILTNCHWLQPRFPDDFWINCKPFERRTDSLFEMVNAAVILAFNSLFVLHWVLAISCLTTTQAKPSRGLQSEELCRQMFAEIVAEISLSQDWILLMWHGASSRCLN